MKHLVLSVLSLVTALSLSAAVMADEKFPNLKPGFKPATGTIIVMNVGDATAGKSVVTVSCKALHGGSCPDPTPAQLAGYTMPAFGNKLAMTVPKIGPSKTFSHVIKFYKDLSFAPGKYVFTVCVDAGKDVRESNEMDNCSRYTMTKRAVGKTKFNLKSRS